MSRESRVESLKARVPVTLRDQLSQAIELENPDLVRIFLIADPVMASGKDLHPVFLELPFILKAMLQANAAKTVAQEDANLAIMERLISKGADIFSPMTYCLNPNEMSTASIIECAKILGVKKAICNAAIKMTCDSQNHPFSTDLAINCIILSVEDLETRIKKWKESGELDIEKHGEQILNWAIKCRKPELIEFLVREINVSPTEDQKEILEEDFDISLNQRRLLMM